MPIRSSLFLRPNRSVLLCLVALACLGSQPLGANSPPRLITLAPHLTELSFEAGADVHLVGVVAFSDYPEKAQSLPRIGDAFQFDFERIVSLNPSHALAWVGGTPQRVAEQLTQLGIEVVWIKTQTLAQIADAILTIASIAGDQTIADENVEQFQQQIGHWQAQSKTVASDQRQRIFYQISAQPLYTFGAGHVINEAFAVCGAENIFKDVSTEAFVVDIESVIDRNPDWILVGTDAQQPNSSTKALPIVHEALSELNASIHAVDANALVRPTTRIVQGINALCALTLNTPAQSASATQE